MGCKQLDKREFEKWKYSVLFLLKKFYTLSLFCPHSTKGFLYNISTHLRDIKEKRYLYMSNTETLQDLILSEVRNEHTPVTLFLMNGFQMKGIITGFDSFVVVLSSEGKQQMIYKHAISTMVPLQPVRFQA